MAEINGNDRTELLIELRTAAGRLEDTITAGQSTQSLAALADVLVQVTRLSRVQTRILDCLLREDG